MSLDVFTFGEAMLRLSVRTGQLLESAPSFDLGASTINLPVDLHLSQIAAIRSAVSIPPGIYA